MKNNEQQAEQQLLTITQQLLVEADPDFHRKLSLTDSLQNQLGIDSLGRAELFHRIEKNFNVQLPDKLIAEAETLQDILTATLHANPAIKLQQPNITQTKLEKANLDPHEAKTLLDVLLLYAITTPNRPHIYLQDEYGNEEIITYGQLLNNSQRVAFEFLKKGLRPGETIAIMQPTNAGFFYTFFGTLLIGCIPVPIYPPFRLHQIESYARQESRILRNAEVRLLVTFQEAEKLSKLLRVFVPSLKEVVTVNSLLKNNEKAPIRTVEETDFALIQYTSGSTSDPKGVLLTHQNLLANIRAYGQAIEVKDTDVAVSWVPLYHDLGLIGMWFGSLYHGIPLTLLSPLTFLNRPERWLWAIHYHRGTLSGGPNFAYELCVKKIEPDSIKGLDLSSWRMAANGAEAIQPKTLDRFYEKFAPYGFRKESFLPVYGLAESSVCVTTSPLNRLPKIDKIQRMYFEREGQAIATNEKNALEFVSCGKPIPKHAIRIVDPQMQALPERHIGPIQFSGPSSMQGYYGNSEATQAIYHDGWWDTGDVGYIAEGELFVTGRKKDLIIKAGRNLYPPEIEELTAQVDGVRQGCVVAFGIGDTTRGTEKLIVIAETREKNSKQKEQITQHINEKIASALDVTPDQIILVLPQTIPKTSSGKLQRSACKMAYINGKLTRKRTPFWLQLSKLSLRFSGMKAFKWFKTIAKVFYTVYLYLIFFITVLPAAILILILPHNLATRVSKYWAKILLFFTFVPIKIRGKENLPSRNDVKARLYACNHASYIDSLILLAYLPTGTCFAAKSELFNVFIVKNLLHKLNYIPVNRTDVVKGIEVTNTIKSALNKGQSIIIYPEGTFSYASGMLPFKLGAFKIATETDTSIIPLSLAGTRHILRGDEWLFSWGKITLTVHQVIQPSGVSWQEISLFRDQVKEQIAKNSGEKILNLIAKKNWS